MDAKVYAIDKVCFNINKSNPTELVIYAHGKVSSRGWTDGRLIIWDCVDRPEDGMLDFDFIAKASGSVLWETSPISGIGRIVLRDWIKGVRVHSASNIVEVLLTDTTCKVDSHVIGLSGPEVPFPF